MNVTIQGKSFKSTPAAFAVMNALCAPAPYGSSGVFLGVNPISRLGIFIDLADMQDKGIINGRTVQAIGPRKVGKSMLMKSIGYREIGLQAGDRSEEDELRKTKLEANDRKPEGKKGQGEWTLFGRATACEFIIVSEKPNLNMFHYSLGMSEAQAHELAVKICEYVGDVPLTALQRFVLVVAIRKMYSGKWKAIAGSDTLQFLLQTLDWTDRINYFKEVDRRILQNHADALSYDPDLKEELEDLMRRQYLPDDNPNKRERNLTLDDFLRTAGELSILIGNSMEGEFGNVIGGKRDPLEFLKAGRVVIDWTGTSRKTQGILEFWMQIVHEISLKHPELDIIPDVRFSDEERMADSVIHLRTRLERMEKARALPTDDWVSLQFEKGVQETIGDEGTAIRGLAKLIDMGIAVKFLGKQPNNPKYLADLGETYNIPEHVLDYATRIAQGDWLVWVNGSREIQLVRHVVTPAELVLGETESATKRKLTRFNLIEEYGYVPAIATPEYIKWLVANGRSININPSN